MPVCFRYHNNEEDARSSLNLGFMKILKGLENVEDDVNFPAWSKRIIVNTLIDEYRKKRNYTSRVTSKETERELDVEGSAETNEAESNFGYESLLKLIKELPDVSQKVPHSTSPENRLREGRGNEGDGEGVLARLDDRERDAVDGDRALLHDVPPQPVGERDAHRRPVLRR